MKWQFTLAVLVLAGCVSPPSDHHQHHGRHGNPADLDAYIRAMEEPERDAWQKPDWVIERLALTPTSTLCDIGAGPGYFALRAAKVARQVLAVDVEPKILDALRERVDRSGATNVIPILGQGADPLLPDRGCAVILIVDTYHHLPEPPAYLRRLHADLAPGGRLVIIDFEKRETPVGPRLERRIARERVIAESKAAGWDLVDEPQGLEYQYFLVFAAAP